MISSMLEEIYFRDKSLWVTNEFPDFVIILSKQQERRQVARYKLRN